RVARAVEGDRAADYLRISSELPLPESVTYHRNAGLARILFIREKRAAERGLHAERGKEVARNRRASNALGGLAADVVERSILVSGNALKRMRLRSPIEKIGDCKRSSIAAGGFHAPVPNHHQPFWFRNQCGFQQHPVDHAEDRGVGADSERKHDQRHYRK